MSKPIYRPLFLEALKNTWRHKRLWLLGIPASMMASGGLFEAISGNWKSAQHGRVLIEQMINGALPGYQWFVSYQRYLGDLEPTRQYIILIFILLVIAAAMVIGVIAQGALFSEALEKQTSNFHELFKKSYRFFWRILWLDLLAKLGMAVFFLITVAPVAFLNPLPYSWHKYPPVVSLFCFLIGAVIISALQMLALSGIVRKHLNVRAALSEAWDIFRLHLLTTIEIGILLFVTSLAAAAAVFFAILVLALPLTLLFVLATIFASPSLYILTIFISFSVIIAAALLGSGFLTAFQYTVWSLYFEEAGRFGIVSKIRRLLKV